MRLLGIQSVAREITFVPYFRVHLNRVYDTQTTLYIAKIIVSLFPFFQTLVNLEEKLQLMLMLVVGP
jgi:hypothetical protein